MARERKTIEINPLCTKEACPPYSESTAKEIMSSIDGAPDELPSLSKQGQGTIKKLKDALNGLFSNKENHKTAKEYAEHQLQDLVHAAQHVKTQEEKNAIEENIKKLEHQLDTIQEYGDDREPYHLEWLRGQKEAI